MKLETFWRFTESLARLSCCKRAGVGCTVIRPDFSEILAIGYNGPPAGFPNDSCRGITGACGCAHAEGNALAKLKGGKSFVMLSTTLQCEHCAGLVVNSGKVAYVIYGEEYRDPAGANLLRGAGVIVVKFEGLFAGGVNEKTPGGHQGS